ncbi:uncharacterized protein LOC126655874 [Mercurialis annua]|uniref:uncharacterized protein LOC126655874 n=1 Tax=Mercurialis annua TaxID=3986 RepID=UPI0021608E48|nr:uncharacterized protein LOC126655874 [Mercurialis annua]
MLNSSNERKGCMPFVVDLNETPSLSPPPLAGDDTHAAFSSPHHPPPVASGEASSDRRGKRVFLDINALPSEAEGQDEEEEEESTHFVSSSMQSVGRHLSSDCPSDTSLLLQKQSELLLQNLRQFVLDCNGVLEDGWRVEFCYSQKKCETLAVYCSPDGHRFDSMVDAACHIGLRMSLNESRSALDAAMTEVTRVSRENEELKIQNTALTNQRDYFQAMLKKGFRDVCSLLLRTTKEQRKILDLDVTRLNSCLEDLKVYKEPPAKSAAPHCV